MLIRNNRDLLNAYQLLATMQTPEFRATAKYPEELDKSIASLKRQCRAFANGAGPRELRRERVA